MSPFWIGAFYLFGFAELIAGCILFYKGLDVIVKVSLKILE